MTRGCRWTASASDRSSQGCDHERDQDQDAATFDPMPYLEGLLEPLGLSTADAGGAISFSGHDPMMADRVRLGAGMGLPMMAGGVGTAALHQILNGVGQTCTWTCARRSTTSRRTSPVTPR